MQTNIKRMLAYSTISHMGFLHAGHPVRHLRRLFSAGMFYAIAYVLMSLGTFGWWSTCRTPAYEAENLDDFKGLNSATPGSPPSWPS
jgi:NADH-quinone oxidoreductase subunit N